MRHGLEVIRPLLHSILDSNKIGHFTGAGRLTQILEDLWHLPSPSFRVPIRERQAATLVMTVRGHIVPDTLGQNGAYWWIAELGVEQGVGMFIDKHEQLAWAGLANLRKPLPCRD